MMGENDLESCGYDVTEESGKDVLENDPTVIAGIFLITLFVHPCQVGSFPFFVADCGIQPVLS